MLPVTCLPLPGVIVKRLLGAGFVFADELFTADNDIQEEVKEVLKSNPELKEVLIEWLKPSNPKTAKDLLEVERKCMRIVCFSYKLDKMLGGGVPLGQVLEVCGPPGSGKTQFCLQLCVSVQLPSSLGGLQSEAVYIDTDAGFSPQRLSEIAQGCKEHCCKVARAKMLPSDVLASLQIETFQNYYYTNVIDYSQLLSTVFSLDDFIKKHNKVKLVVIDSLPFLFLHQKDLLKRTILLCKIVQQLSKMACHHNISVVLTNHLTTRITRGEDQLIPALGECVGHLINSRIILGRLPEDLCYGSVVYKSPGLCNDSTVFKITEGGLRD